MSKQNRFLFSFIDSVLLTKTFARMCNRKALERPRKSSASQYASFRFILGNFLTINSPESKAIYNGFKLDLLVRWKTRKQSLFIYSQIRLVHVSQFRGLLVGYRNMYRMIEWAMTFDPSDLFLTIATLQVNKKTFLKAPPKFHGYMRKYVRLSSPVTHFPHFFCKLCILVSVIWGSWRG